MEQKSLLGIHDNQYESIQWNNQSNLVLNWLTWDCAEINVLIILYVELSTITFTPTQVMPAGH